MDMQTFLEGRGGGGGIVFAINENSHYRLNQFLLQMRFSVYIHLHVYTCTCMYVNLLNATWLLTFISVPLTLSLAKQSNVYACISCSF